MKRFSKIAVILLMMIAAVFTVTACNNVTSIAINESDLPRDTYVQGQDLDLSEGSIVVARGDETETLALNAEGVNISGYDKNTLGEQTVTVEYGGQTANFTVTVYTRITAENYVSDYLVGESFDTSKGRIRIVNDDGSFTTASLSDSTVTISGFDSSSAGTGRSVTVSYSSGSVNYTGTFTVNVYAIDEQDFHGPSKRSYRSHETEIDLTGAYLVLSGNNGALSRTIAASDFDEDMISGFDPSAATEENRETPLYQTVTLTYSGVSYTYEIQIYYTDVTAIKEAAEEFSALDWSGESLPAVTEEQGETAFDLLERYEELDAEDLPYVADDDLEVLARTAAVYGYTRWTEVASEYAHTFAVSQGTMTLICDSYEAVKADYTKLAEEDNEFYTLSSRLTEIKSSYGSVTLPTVDEEGANVTLETYLSEVYDPSNYSTVLSQLEYMITLYETLDDVPDNWTTESLADYDAAIAEACSTMTNGKFNSNRTSAYRSMHAIVSSWRANDDFFEIIYRYYYSVDNMDAIAGIKDIYLPGVLQELYECIYSAITQISYLGNLMVSDTLYLMWYYTTAVELANEAASSEDEMYAALYNSLTFDNLLTIGGEAASVSYETLLRYVLTAESRNSQYSVYYGGVYYNLGTGLGMDDVDALWGMYLNVYDNLLNTADYVRDEGFAADVVEMFETFAALTPSHQYAFLCSVNPYYSYGVPTDALDYYTSGAYTYFINWIALYYESVLTNNGIAVFRNLLTAMEDFMNYRVSTSQSYADLKTSFSALTTAYNALSANDKEVFDRYLGDVYEKYSEIDENYVSGWTETDLGDWESYFEEAASAISGVYTAYTLVSSGLSDSALWALIFSSYEKAQSIADYVLANAPAAIAQAFCYESYDIFSINSTYLDWSIDSSLFYVRGIYITYMTGLSLTVGETSYTFWELYSATDALPAFMAAVDDMLWVYTYETYSQDPSSLDPYTSEDLNSGVAAMKMLRELSSYNLFVFRSLSGIDAYHAGLNAVFADTMTANAAAAAKLLLAAEDAYVDYKISPEGSDGNGTTYESLFKTAMEAAITAYNALTGDDLSSFNAIADAYAYYLAAYEALDASVAE